MPGTESNTEQFLNLNPKRGKGKFKIYIGMSAGVGKTYRMLQEAHALLQRKTVRGAGCAGHFITSS